MVLIPDYVHNEIWYEIHEAEDGRRLSGRNHEKQYYRVVSEEIVNQSGLRYCNISEGVCCLAP